MHHKNFMGVGIVYLPHGGHQFVLANEILDRSLLPK